MLFNSFAFGIFLPVVFLAYWAYFAKEHRRRNLFLLVASYVFYGWWDWRFLGLIVASSLTDFAIGSAMARSSLPQQRRALLALSLLVNLGILGFFKYANFFIGGMADLLQALGFHPHMPTLRIILPVGISFYTFQTLSYTIDIYRGQVKPTRDLIAFLAFVGFFPQLVAGPIERARTFLPQFERLHAFDPTAARDGLRQMLWGFFKKVAVADTCAPLVDAIFNGDIAHTPGITLFFGAFFFAFQIYGDFSGYSDIAIGTARLFGFQLSRNFAYPYFARDISEFWRRWHISLSTWFRDYVYVPLGGWRSRVGRARNILLTFAVSGLWHGANWTFITWGALHGLYHLPMVAANDRAQRGEASWRDLHRIAFTFLLVTLAWVFFRAASVKDSIGFLRHMVANSAMTPGVLLLHVLRPEMVMILVLLLAEWRARHLQHALERMPCSIIVRWTIYLALTLAVLANIDLHRPHEFIYFRF